MYTNGKKSSVSSISSFVPYRPTSITEDTLRLLVSEDVDELILDVFLLAWDVVYGVEDSILLAESHVGFNDQPQNLRMDIQFKGLGKASFAAVV